MKRVLLSSGILILGFFLGSLVTARLHARLPRLLVHTQEETSAPAPVQEDGERIVSPPEPEPPTTDVEETPEPADAAASAPAPAGTNERAAATVTIPAKFLPKIHCAVIDTLSNCVADEVVELLEITPEQRVQLNRFIAVTRERVLAREVERATVTEQSSQRVALRIAADPEQGRESQDFFAAGVRDVLGARAEEFLQRMQPYEAMVFSNFGRYDTLLTVTRDPATGLLRMESRQEYVTPAGARGSCTTSTISEDVPERWRKFFQPGKPTPAGESE